MIAVAAIAIPIVIIYGEGDWISGVAVVGLLIGLPFLQVFSELGYRVSWDSARIYERPRGTRWNFGRYPETSIAFDDIVSVEGEYGPVPGLQKHFMPFDHIRIAGRTSGPEPVVTISPNFMNVDDAKRILRIIQERRPEVLAPEVAEFLKSDRAW